MCIMRNVCSFFFGGGGGGGGKLNERLPDLHADGSITKKWVSNKLVGRRGQTSSDSR